MSEPFKKRAAEFWKKQAKPFLLMVLVLMSFRSAVADWNDVPTGSMKPSILEGDRIFVNKLAYDLKVPFTTWHIATWSAPKRGDVVVFNSPADGTRLVKRVVGLPGETIELKHNVLYVNGQPADYQPLDPKLQDAIPIAEQPSYVFRAEELNGMKHPVMVTPSVLAMRSFGPKTLGPGEFFMMGDNRDNSKDSRFIGPVPRNAIVGRATGVVLSLDPKHYWLPRWGRSFTGMP
jgi:signal peptidase I